MTEEDPSPKRYHEDASVPRRLIVSKRATERKRYQEYVFRTEPIAINTVPRGEGRGKNKY